MPQKHHEILRRETLFQGYFRVDRYQVRHERHAGGLSGSFTREIFERGSASAVLPFDPLQDKVVLIEQFRAGPMARGDDPWLFELVAGIIEAGESSESTARREAEEEAGCTIAELQPIASYYPSPGCMTEHATLFIGRVTVPQDGLIMGVDAEHEDIKVHVLDAHQAISMLMAGKFRDSATIIAMQWFAMHHTELRSRWIVSDASTMII
jgi:ADP-ribose pyrophosphatase